MRQSDRELLTFLASVNDTKSEPRKVGKRFRDAYSLAKQMGLLKRNDLTPVATATRMQSLIDQLREVRTDLLSFEHHESARKCAQVLQLIQTHIAAAAKYLGPRTRHSSHGEHDG